MNLKKCVISQQGQPLRFRSHSAGLSLVLLKRFSTIEENLRVASKILFQAFDDRQKQKKHKDLPYFKIQWRARFILVPAHLQTTDLEIVEREEDKDLLMHFDGYVMIQGANLPSRMSPEIIGCISGYKTKIVMRNVSHDLDNFNPKNFWKRGYRLWMICEDGSIIEEKDPQFHPEDFMNRICNKDQKQILHEGKMEVESEKENEHSRPFSPPLIDDGQDMWISAMITESKKEQPIEIGGDQVQLNIDCSTAANTFLSARGDGNNTEDSYSGPPSNWSEQYGKMESTLKAKINTLEEENASLRGKVTNLEMQNNQQNKKIQELEENLNLIIKKMETLQPPKENKDEITQTESDRQEDKGSQVVPRDLREQNRFSNTRKMDLETIKTPELGWRTKKRKIVFDDTEISMTTPTSISDHERVLEQFYPQVSEQNGEDQEGSFNKLLRSQKITSKPIPEEAKISCLTPAKKKFSNLTLFKSLSENEFVTPEMIDKSIELLRPKCPRGPLAHNIHLFKTSTFASLKKGEGLFDERFLDRSNKTLLVFPIFKESQAKKYKFSLFILQNAGYFEGKRANSKLDKSLQLRGYVLDFEAQKNDQYYSDPILSFILVMKQRAQATQIDPNKKIFFDINNYKMEEEKIALPDSKVQSTGLHLIEILRALIANPALFMKEARQKNGYGRNYVLNEEEMRKNIYAPLYSP